MDNLPACCESCRPYGGCWMESGIGLSRCICVRGHALRAVDEARLKAQRLPPVLTETETLICVEMLAAIPFFPIEAGARVAIGNEISSMCQDFTDGLWLSQRMVGLYARWPGGPELRLVYCAARLPLDGVQPLLLTSETYPEGIPSERPTEAAQLESGMKQLPAGVVVSAAPSLDRAVVALAAAKDLNREGSRGRRIPDIPLVREVPFEKRITQADIDRAVGELHEKRARVELGLDA